MRICKDSLHAPATIECCYWFECTVDLSNFILLIGLIKTECFHCTFYEIFCLIFLFFIFAYLSIWLILWLLWTLASTCNVLDEKLNSLYAVKSTTIRQYVINSVITKLDDSHYHWYRKFYHLLIRAYVKHRWGK